ncbi:DUF72 domain-containing protein [Sphingobacterium psychroaquaticum]|uniref:Uncharacterized conserved protein YecE, DUF72 family n=1 Tax=Sphingobacterium psychroaquaticum TaxID=561061 RepID=A0A1X7I824_9SPHI|nr:DUF72 domain-containing protein [Sphingobacterium psychroaquaticum]QBQ41831.1 DUF72 domain-containing protein [Sphingobacterium psychroaquaticum]SMG10739.1 Uncharacterized conserved protein YecE, DUF72 family [Sphingobacterium psychroaquaticum]
MKFGQVNNPEAIDFTLPPTSKVSLEVLEHYQSDTPFEAYVGCAKWNKTDLKGFYPRGTKDELAYYSRQFNAIELNATFYNSPSKEQVETWRDKTPDGFKFFPKIPQSVSHYSRLLNTNDKIKAFVDSTALFKEKMGMAFLQMHDNYKPKDFDRLAHFLHDFPKDYPLALEVRNEEWFKDEVTREKLYKLLEETGTTNVLVDTAGRRDMLHMRHTTNSAFVRYVGANHPSDYDRLLDWVQVIKDWKAAGLQRLYFFIHQNLEVESPLLAAHFITHLNKEIGTTLNIPNKGQLGLF